MSVYHKDMDTLTQREIDAEFLRSFVIKVEGLLPEGVATCDECGMHSEHEHTQDDSFEFMYVSKYDGSMVRWLPEYRDVFMVENENGDVWIEDRNDWDWYHAPIDPALLPQGPDVPNHWL